MKRIIYGFFILSAIGRADEHTDRNAIQNIVEALNTDGRSVDGKEQLPTLFTADADNELARLSDLDKQLTSHNTPWSEVTKPRIVVRSIRFITADVALVDAVNTQYGSTILVRRIPVLVVMRREATGWRIASFRVMVDVMKLP